jgi:hypothetical protein
MEIICTYKHQELGPGENPFAHPGARRSRTILAHRCLDTQTDTSLLANCKIRGQARLRSTLVCLGDRCQQLYLSCDGYSLPVFACLHNALQLSDKRRIQDLECCETVINCVLVCGRVTQKYLFI